MNTWYPGSRVRHPKVVETLKKKPCPVCNGLRKVHDKKTHLIRDCVGCKGTGIVK